MRRPDQYSRHLRGGELRPPESKSLARRGKQRSPELPQESLRRIQPHLRTLSPPWCHRPLTVARYGCASSHRQTRPRQGNAGWNSHCHRLRTECAGWGDVRPGGGGPDVRSTAGPSPALRHCTARFACGRRAATRPVRAAGQARGAGTRPAQRSMTARGMVRLTRCSNSARVRWRPPSCGIEWPWDRNDTECNERHGPAELHAPDVHPSP
jgi:hypothetical protein